MYLILKLELELELALELELKLELQNRAGIVFDNALPEEVSQNAVM
jgi:hypothetical protein